VDLANDTGVPAILYRTVIDEHRMASALVARVTYRIAPDGRLTRDAEQPWIVSKAPWEGPAGPMHSDEVFLRGGVDLFVFGQAWAPGGRPIARTPFGVTVGVTFRYELMVVGDRAWTGRGEALSPSSPRPFVSMPLTLAQAFGGKGNWDGLEIPYGDNPDGKGYRLDAKAALDAPLPNLEDPAAPIRRWNDTPEPVGVGVRPLAFGPHLRQAVVFRDDGVMQELKPTYFNHAFPRLVVPKVEPGDVVTITGGSPDGPVRLVMPPRSLLMDLSIGPARLERPLAIDQIGVELEQRRAFITYRYPFRYTLVPRERRTCTLRTRKEGV
jgi:hypothetical protein